MPPIPRPKRPADDDAPTVLGSPWLTDRVDAPPAPLPPLVADAPEQLLGEAAPASSDG